MKSSAKDTSRGLSHTSRSSINLQNIWYQKKNFRMLCWGYFPANIRLDEDVFRLHLDKFVRLSLTSSLDVLVKTNIFVLAIRLEDVFKNVLKTSSRRLAKMSSRRLEKRLQDVLKTFSRHLQDVLQRCLQEVSKMYYQVKLFVLTRLWEAFNMFLRRSFPKTVIYRGLCLRNTTSYKCMVSVPNLQER